MAVQRLLSHRVTLLAHLLLAASLLAQEKPWEAEQVSIDGLEAAAKSLKAEIKPLPEDATAEQKAFDAARRARLGILRKYIDYARGIGEVDRIANAEQEAESWSNRTSALRDRPAEPLPAIAGAGDLDPIIDAARAAAEAVAKVEQRLARLKSIGGDVEKRVASIPTRRSELQEVVTRSGDTKPDSIEAYRLDNARLELRMLADLERAAVKLRGAIVDEHKVRTAELDHLRLVARRAADRLTAARKALEEATAAEAARLEKKKQDLEKAKADKSQDAVQRFRAAVQVEIATIEQKLKLDESVHSQLDRRVTTEKALLDQFKKSHERLAERAARSDSITSAGAKELHTQLLQTDRRAEAIARVALPNVQRDLGATERELIGVQDQEWDLELAPEDTQIWKRYIEPLPPADQERAVGVFDELVVGTSGLRAKLRERVASLTKTHRSWIALESHYEAQLDSLEKVESLIRSRIYWVRTDPPLGRDLVESLARETKSFGSFYAETEFVEEWNTAFHAQPGLIVGGFLLLALLLAGSTLAARRLKAHRMSRPAEGSRFKSGIADALRMVFHAAVPSLVLIGASLLVQRMTLPARVAFPLITIFEVVALLLFLQRLAWGLLNEQGYLVNHYGIDPAVAKQSLRSVRILTLGAMFFHVPELILAEAPFEKDAVLRLFGTAFRASQLLALALLLPRRKPVAQAFVGESEIGGRIVAAIAPIALLAFAVIFAMDWLGYRYGAAFFTERAVESFLTILALRAVYAGLSQISERVVVRVRDRAHAERGSKAAWEDSERLAPQLSRVITVATLVAAVLFLAGAWRVGDSFGGLLSEWTVVELTSQGTSITVADVLVAFLWVIGAHFLASNIGGVFELLIFPVFGNIHRGTRYVVLALNRYIILLIGYSAALVVLHFSLQSVGWLLAAASVGLGFGLQEIVANFVSGLILLVEQPARVGDVISVGDSGGTVEKITIRATIVTNWDQQQIIIPNKSFITQNLTNWTRNNNFTRRKIPLRIAYGSDVEKALAVLEATVKEQENVRSYPPPRIWFNGFGESGLEIECWIYVDMDFGFSTMSNVRTAIYTALREAGIEIPLPKRDVYYRNASELDAMTDQQAAAGTLENIAAPAEPDGEEDEA